MNLFFFKPKKTLLYLLYILAFFLLSFLGFLYPILNYSIFWLIVIAVMILAIRNISDGLFIVFLELIVGNKGYLFSFPVAGFVISLRLALFIVVIISYLISIIFSKKDKISFLQSNLRFAFLILVLVLGIGLVNGLLNNSPKVVFYDINAYFFLALIFPIFHVFKNRENFFKFIKIFSLGALALSFFTLIIFFDFGIFHYNPAMITATQVEAKQLEQLNELSNLPENARLAQTTQIAENKLKINWSEVAKNKTQVYRWLKDTGNAEVTYLGNRFFRVFMISHFYLMLYLIFIVSYFFYKPKTAGKTNFRQILLSILLIIVSFISFSRSLWLGFVLSACTLIIGLPRKKIFKFLICLLIIILLIFTVCYFALPSLLQLIYSRISSLVHPTTELAATNRLSLLTPIWQSIKNHPFFGSGFGTLITFRSLIPGTDLVEYIKVYVYEWGYLDIIVKIGVLGLLALCYFIFMIFKNSLFFIKQNSDDDYFLIRAFIAGLFYLVIVHFTTPYINHPLGLGFMLLTAAFFADNQKKLKTYGPV